MKHLKYLQTVAEFPQPPNQDPIENKRILLKCLEELLTQKCQQFEQLSGIKEASFSTTNGMTYCLECTTTNNNHFRIDDFIIFDRNIDIFILSDRVEGMIDGNFKDIWEQIYDYEMAPKVI